MIHANRNQLANVDNSYQGKAKRVLCVCSAGLLRSPTAAKVLQQKYGYNTRACGINEEFALIPISQALIRWADEIVFMEESHREAVEYFVTEMAKKNVEQYVLNVPDYYSYSDPTLEHLILKAYEEARRQ